MNSNFIYALYINDPDHDNGKAVKFDTVEAAIKAAQDAVHDDPFYTHAEIMKLDARMRDAWESYITIDSDGNAIAYTDDAQREANKVQPSGYRGVSSIPRAGGKVKYMGYFRMKNKYYHTKPYETPDEAKEARDALMEKVLAETGLDELAPKTKKED